MTCNEVENLLSSYLDGDLSPAERSLLEGHLGTCRDCGLLFSALKDAQTSLTGFPELDVSGELLSRLYTIPERKRKFRFSLDFLLKPSLQPVFAAATVLMIMVSFYLFNPDKKSIDRSINQKIHSGYSQAEKLYAKAGSWTDRLDATKDSIFVSIKSWKIFGGDKD